MRAESRSGCYSPALAHRVVTCRLKVGSSRIQPVHRGAVGREERQAVRTVSRRWAGTHSPAWGYCGALQVRTRVVEDEDG